MKKSPLPPGKAAALCLGILIGATSAHAASYSYTPIATSGTWSNAGSWTPTPAAGGPSTAGDIDNVNSNITATTTINIFNTGDLGTAVKTVGVLNIGDTNAGSIFTLAAGSGGGSLSFDNNGAGAQINELSTAKNDTISAPITIADGGASAGSLTISTSATAATSVFTLSGGITSTGAGAKNLIFNTAGNASIVISGSVNNAGSISNTGVSGTTTISGLVGTNVTSITQSGSNSTLFVGAGLGAGSAANLNVSSGTLRGFAANNLNTTGLLTLSGGAFDLNNGNASVGGLSDGGTSGGTISNTNAGGATLKQLTITGTGGQSFSGTITNAGGDIRVAVSLSSGAQTFAGANTYTGFTSVTSGTLILAHAGAIGTGGGSAISLTGTSALVSNVANAITGTSSLALGTNAAQITTATLNATNNFTGAITMGNSAANVLTLTDVNAIANASSLTVTAGMVRLLSDTAATFVTPNASTTAVTYFVGNNGGAGVNQTIDISGTITPVSGRVITVAGANGYRLAIDNLNLLGSGATVTPTTANVTIKNVTNSGVSGIQSLVLSGSSNTGTNIVSANLANGATGTTAVTLSGSTSGVTWALTGSNTYTGATTITVGTLLVDGSHTGGGAYTVAAGGGLGGTGSVSTSSVTTAAGSKLTPGDGGIGNLTLSLSGTLNIAASSTGAGNYLFDLGTSNSSDRITLTTGTLNFGNFNFADFTFTGGAAGQTYILFDANSAISFGTIGTLTGTVNGGIGATLSYDSLNNNILLTTAAIPEPQTWAMFAMGGFGILIFVRRARGIQSR